MLIIRGKEETKSNGMNLNDGGIKMERKKELQASEWDRKFLTGDQIKYAAVDSFVLLPIRKAIIERLKEYHLINAAKLDFDAVEPVAMMELAGFLMNKRRWLEKHEATVVERDETAQKLYSILAPGGVPQQILFDGAPEQVPINLNSRPQLIVAMQKLGIKLPLLDEKITTRTYKLPASDKSALTQHASHAPIRIYNRYQKMTVIASALKQRQATRLFGVITR